MATPTFRVIANTDDITAQIRERFKSLRLVDETGTTSDAVEITLADHDPLRPIKLPPTGAELEIFLGYDDATQAKGVFVCDEIELSGFPGEVVIRARAAPYEESKDGMRALQTQKARSWPGGTTIGAMVKRIAGEHRLTASVSPALASIALPHTDQSHESDMNLLSRSATTPLRSRPAGSWCSRRGATRSPPAARTFRA